MKINLHCHSNKSDGANAPSDLIDILTRNGMDIISLTDHDTIAGLCEARGQCQKRDIHFIPGIEFSASLAESSLSFATKYTACHILAYGFDVEMMKERIKKHHAKMKAGVIALITDLRSMGYDISELDMPNNDFWTSLDVARTLVKKAYSTGVWKAFDTIIGKAEHRRIFFLDPKEIIAMVHECGGLAFAAHPFDIIEDDMKIRVSKENANELLSYLTYNGIDGIEGHYQPYEQGMRDSSLEFAKKNNLLISYGTDYHGGRTYEEGKYIDVTEVPDWITKLTIKNDE
ncbi:MAG: PHP domain-containing protein [Desulfobacterales bacterium]|jgi:predicted metal-dependent phosphoesterase TrpH|nr:PHP domain-containing protein [Desulfobacterales bacterium]